MESAAVVELPKFKTERTQWETPNVSYDIKAHDLLKILQKRISAKVLSKETTAKLFTDLIDYSTVVVEEPPNLKRGVRKLPKERTIPDFTEKQVYALFHMPDAGAYQYLELRIAPSQVKGAGLGVYAVDPIPNGAMGEYKGVSKQSRFTNHSYAWEVKQYDRRSGEVLSENAAFYIDAFDLDRSNWTRFVNTGTTREQNNMDSDQYFTTFYYVANRDIKSGEELFIDYGEEYRKDNLNLLYEGEGEEEDADAEEEESGKEND